MFVKYSLMYKAFLFALFTSAIFGSCDAPEKVKVNETALVAPPTLNFTTDQRLEVLYLAFMLAEYPLVSKYETDYKKAAEVYFEGHNNHEVVLLLKKLMYRGFNFDYAVNWIWQHTDFPALEPNRDINFPFATRPINQDSLNLLRIGLRKFYTDANCQEFLYQQQAFLDSMVSNAQHRFERKDLVEVITEYIGIPPAGSYYVVLSPLLHSGGYAVHRTDVTEFSAIAGPGGLDGTMPLFDAITLEQDLVIHEFSHNYVNPIVDEFFTKMAPLEDLLYTPYKEAIAETGYNSWKGFVYELMVRATTVRIVETVYGKASAKELIDYEESEGFVFVDDVAEILKSYESKRKEYPTLRDFYPEIIDQLGKLDRTASSGDR